MNRLDEALTKRIDGIGSKWETFQILPIHRLLLHSLTLSLSSLTLSNTLSLYFFFSLPLSSLPLSLPLCSIFSSSTTNTHFASFVYFPSLFLSFHFVPFPLPLSVSLSFSLSHSVSLTLPNGKLFLNKSFSYFKIKSGCTKLRNKEYFFNAGTCLNTDRSMSCWAWTSWYVILYQV